MLPSEHWQCQHFTRDPPTQHHQCQVFGSEHPIPPDVILEHFLRYKLMESLFVKLFG